MILSLFVMATVAAATPDLDLRQSLKLAKAAIKNCARHGQSVASSVVDVHGIPIVVLRADGLEKLPSAATRKAATAVAFGSSGADMERRMKVDTQFASTIAANRDLFNPDGGSLPLYRKGQLVGGLAVAYTSHEMADSCVRAALEQHPLE